MLNPGLYCISCSVFSGSCPTLAVEVNGVVVLRRVGSSRRITDAASQIAGTSLRDFLSLPAGGCRVSIRLESYGLGPANSHDMDQSPDAIKNRKRITCIVVCSPL